VSWFSLEVCSARRRGCSPRVCSFFFLHAMIDVGIGIHPTTIAQSFQKAATKAVEFLEEMSTPVDLNDRESLLRAAGTSLNSKVSW